MKKGNVCRGMETFSHCDFYLSPYEFFGIVWIYRNEVKPLCDKLCAGDEPPCLKLGDINSLAKKLRRAILDKCAVKTDFSVDEQRFLFLSLPRIFAPFAAESAPVRKPDDETLQNLRNVVADFINYDKFGSYYNLESSMTNGKIKFSIQYRV